MSDTSGDGAVSASSDDLMDVVRLLPDVLFRCYKADDGNIYWSMNEGGLAEQFGLTTKDIQGKSLDELFPGGASDALHEHFQDAFRGKPTIFTNEIEGRHFRHFPQPIFEADGSVREVVGFIAEVTELVETERALQLANEELEAFTYTASHDFRGPLTAMRLDAATLLGRLDPGSKEYQNAKRIAQSTERLSGLVDGLLQLSRASRGELSRRMVSISGAARMISEMLDRENPSLHVEWVIADDLTVDADPTLAEAALQNLMENAWKFSSKQPKPRIEIRAGPEGAIEVADNGPGFEEADTDSMFTAFTRLTSDQPGSGIGLATVKRIMDRHGGTVVAEGNPGEGAVFRLHFGRPA